MNKRYIMTAFGEDRPGLIADVTELIYEYGYNLEDSRMTRLLDEFVIVISFSGPVDQEKNMQLACRRLEKEKGITAYFRPVDEKKIKSKKEYDIQKLSIEGFDQAGIVYKITRMLADRGINIENLESRIVPSPESGSNVYKMNIYIQVPKGTDIKSINSDLEHLSNDLNIDITLE